MPASPPNLPPQGPGPARASNWRQIHPRVPRDKYLNALLSAASSKELHSSYLHSPITTPSLRRAVSNPSHHLASRTTTITPTSTMPSLQSALPLSLLLAAAAAFSPSPAFVTVLNATEPDSTASLGNLTTADTVGCLDSAGQFTTTAADCALFYSGTAQQWLATDAGNCSWANSALDFNTDSAYGQLDHAFSCAPDLAAADSDVVYSLVRVLFFFSRERLVVVAGP